MARDYEKESVWRKRKYTRLVADVEPEQAERFRQKLASEKISYADWLREHIKEYLRKE